jgi:hypothetical protein
VTPPKILSNRSGSDEGQLLFEASHALSDFPLVFFACLAAIGLPIGFETAPLIDVDENAANLEGHEFMIKAPCPYSIRIKRGKLPTFRLMLRHETMLDKKSHDVGAALQEPVTAASGGSRHTPFFCKRASVLRVATIVKDTDAAIDELGNGGGIALLGEIAKAIDRPPNGVRPEIEGKTKGSLQGIDLII